MKELRQDISQKQEATITLGARRTMGQPWCLSSSQSPVFLQCLFLAKHMEASQHLRTGKEVSSLQYKAEQRKELLLEPYQQTLCFSPAPAQAVFTSCLDCLYSLLTGLPATSFFLLLHISSRVLLLQDNSMHVILTLKPRCAPHFPWDIVQLLQNGPTRSFILRIQVTVGQKWLNRSCFLWYNIKSLLLHMPSLPSHRQLKIQTSLFHAP